MPRCVVALMICCTLAMADSRSTAPPRDLRHATPQLHAIINARIVVSPDTTLERGTIVFRDGRIEAVGAGITPPADARLYDLEGKMVYPGLIDPFSEPSPPPGARATGGTAAGTRSDTPPTPPAGPAHWNRQVLADFRVDRAYSPDPELHRKLRSQGIVARLAVPTRGILKGTSALVETSDDEPAQALIKPLVAQHAALTPSRGRFNPETTDESRYPTSPMGAFTLVRQTIYDAQWYASAFAAAGRNPRLAPPHRNAALEALAEQLSAGVPLIIDAPDELYALRAGAIAREFNVAVIIRGSGQEQLRLAEVASMQLPILLPVSFPRPPNVASPEAAMNVSLAELMEWDLAPENPARLHAAGVTIALTSHGLRDKADFLKNVRRAVARGLPKDAALQAMTLTPARLLGVDQVLGTIEVGKSASFVVTDGDLFDEKSRVIDTWVDGKRFEIAPRNVVDIRGKWALSGFEAAAWELSVEGDPTRPTVRLAPPRDSDAPATQPATHPATTRPAAIEGTNVAVQDVRLSFTFKHDSLGIDGKALFSGVFEENAARGVVITPDGGSKPVSLARTAPPTTTPATASRRGRRGSDDTGDAAGPPSTGPSTQPASFAVHYPLGDFGRRSLPEQPSAVVFRNAIVWTCGPAGVIEQGDVLIENGRIKAVGRSLNAPPGAEVVDCSGRHLTPGIIDCHSHMATDGGVNEAGQNITAEVRISDFIDPDDINIYRQLAAGVTAVNILHGSANAIGGQNQVIKLRWGAGPEEMKLAGAPEGIKFALGENPRGANRTNLREGEAEYPQTRMGVEQLIRNAFAAARDYRASQRRASADPAQQLPVRKDLELEAIAEILEGKRWIHCHSYRQDEILALLRLCEEFKVQVGSLQHILEGYKVADAIARHGATASSFSDWWAYKAEVYDAIPYNGALMHGRGIIVSFNSDDAELARRLHTEAAKAIKYGGVPREEALKFVTINPARQLRIDDRVGSIEIGKDADLAIWSAAPMSTYAVCQQTWIDGRRYFDIDEDQQLRRRDQQMRRTLIQKILA
ncbi:MAG: amidohydrolase family protein, partial [Phycisphaerae bacterium]|nr:amidohydrolase family protein [Phycisphaerae bacterium]MDW8261096.1 amidohydrolase family protein [Phycisphaerales bacterium]